MSSASLLHVFTLFFYLHHEIEGLRKRSATDGDKTAMCLYVSYDGAGESYGCRRGLNSALKAPPIYLLGCSQPFFNCRSTRWDEVLPGVLIQ